MAAVPEVRPRCMIWLGKPSMLEREVLAAAGWDLRIITDPSGARIGVRGSDRVAVVLDLRDAGEDWIASIQALLAPHSDLPVATLGEADDYYSASLKLLANLAAREASAARRP